MILTPEQEAAVKLIKERYEQGCKYTCIAGYAGSGKSVCISHAIESLGVNEDDVCYLSYTGKAVEVLKRYGCKHTSTIHHLMYESAPNADGTFYHRRRRTLPYKIVIIDEVSMVSKDLINSLFRYKNTYFILSGDNAQLPPVDKNSDNHLLDTPHIFFTQIMRQAMDSEIIRLCTAIRNGETINAVDYTKDVKILNYNDLSTGMLLWADQVICATNATRIKYNNIIRDLKHPGLTEPQDGDKVICCRNYWNLGMDDEEQETNEEPIALVNGMTGIIHNPRTKQVKLPLRKVGNIMDWMYCDFESDTGDIFEDLYLDRLMLDTGKPTMSWDIQYKLYKKHKDMIPFEFTWGDVITCHKAQGSTFGRVLVMEENFPFDSIEHSKWLYTACTRPSDKLVLIQK